MYQCETGVPPFADDVNDAQNESITPFSAALHIAPDSNYWSIHSDFDTDMHGI